MVSLLDYLFKFYSIHPSNIDLHLRTTVDSQNRFKPWTLLSCEGPAQRYESPALRAQRCESSGLRAQLSAAQRCEDLSAVRAQRSALCELSAARRCEDLSAVRAQRGDPSAVRAQC